MFGGSFQLERPSLGQSFTISCQGPVGCFAQSSVIGLGARLRSEALQVRIRLSPCLLSSSGRNNWAVGGVVSTSTRISGKSPATGLGLDRPTLPWDSQLP